MSTNLHRARIIPRCKPQSILSRHSAKVNYKREDEQAHNRDDFETCENEFSFAVDSDRKDV